MGSIDASYSRVCGEDGVCMIRLTSIDNGVKHKTVRRLCRDNSGCVVVSNEAGEFDGDCAVCGSYEEARNLIRDIHNSLYSKGVRRWSYIGCGI